MQWNTWGLSWTETLWVSLRYWGFSACGEQTFKSNHLAYTLCWAVLITTRWECSPCRLSKRQQRNPSWNPTSKSILPLLTDVQPCSKPEINLFPFRSTFLFILNYAQFYAKHREALSQHLTCICCCLFLGPVNYSKATPPTKNQFPSVEVPTGQLHIASLPFKADIITFSFISLILQLRDELGKNGDFILPVNSGFMICS